MLQIVLKGESQTRVEGENRCSAKNFRLEKKEFRKEEEKKEIEREPDFRYVRLHGRVPLCIVQTTARGENSSYVSSLFDRPFFLLLSLSLNDSLQQAPFSRNAQWAHTKLSPAVLSTLTKKEV